MNKKDFEKIRRRLNADGKNPIEIRGMFVNSKKAVISEFTKHIVTMGSTEAGMYLQLFKRILSGDVGKNITQLRFPQEEVMDGEFHARLMSMVHDSFENEEVTQEFLNSILEQTKLDGNYLILLLHDSMDLDYMGTRDEGALDETQATAMFNYILCAVCPVKTGKSALTYNGQDNEFVSRDPEMLVTAPEMGFMFPAFEDGGANISTAMFYSKDMGMDHGDFIASALNASNVAPVLERKETFKGVLQDALEEECSYDVVQSVNEQLLDKLEEQKKDKESEPLQISGGELAQILTDCGVSDDRADTFVKRFDEQFGKGADLPVAGIADDRQFEVKTPNVSVKVSPKQAGLIETRVIDGVKYILIPADDGVTVNGINIDI